MILPPWAYAAAGAAVFAMGAGAGYKVRTWQDDSAQLHQVKADTKQNNVDQDNADHAATHYEANRNDTAVRAAAREVQIRTVYRDRPAAVGCDPDPGAVGVLDDALGEANAKAAGQPGGAVPGASSSP